MANADLTAFDTARLEAIIETMFLAAHADGEFSDEERAHFTKTVLKLTDGHLAGDALDGLLARIRRQLADEGQSARLRAVRDRLPAGWPREIALELAIKLMAADGIIRTSERELILEAAEALEVDRGHAADLVRQAQSTE
jgi:tellurite resistance protein